MNQQTYDWFNRTVGRWSSERRYIFNLETMKPTCLTTVFSIGAAEDWMNWDYRVEWAGQTSGTMNLKLNGNELHRDIGYFTKDPTVSYLSMIDPDTLLMITSYDGMTFREEVRLLFNDSLRLRQTVGRSIEDASVRLVGQYYETRQS